MFKGNFTALVTPFKDGALDVASFTSFVDWQIQQGVHGLVPCGTTGEAITLSDAEYEQVIRIAVERAAKAVPVIAGSGTNSTEKTIYFSKLAEKAGADALLVVTPYYNKPSQDGLFAHFKAVHDATTLPIVLYDIPGRSIVEIALDTYARLSQLPRIIGVKDATNSLAKPLQIAAVCGAEFCQLSGEDATSFAHLAQGGQGCISVTSNVAPKLCAELQNAWMKGEVEKAQQINLKLQPLREAMFCETNPAPAKYGTELLGFGSCEPRLPLVAASAKAKAQVEKSLRDLELLPS